MILIFLQDGEGDHRFGYFVLRQRTGRLDYSAEGGPTDSCSPNMSEGRGPFRYTAWSKKKYCMFEVPAFLLPTNPGLQMHSPSLLTERTRVTELSKVFFCSTL